MAKITKKRLIYLVLVLIFAVVFSIGIFQNPHFNLYDFCMNLASEILGLTLALTIVDLYIREKRK